MNRNAIFDPGRFFLLLKKEFLTDKKRPLIIAGATFGILTVILFSFALDNPNDHELTYFHDLWFPIVFLTGGFIFTSVAFNELDSKTDTHQYLSLPASTFEKFLSKLFLTTIGFIIATVVGYWLYTTIVNSISNNLLNTQIAPLSFSRPLENAEGSTMFLMIKIYIAVQSIFLLGAVVFRKYVVFKTALSAITFSMIFGTCAFILFRIIFFDYFEGMFSINTRNIALALNDSGKTFMEGTFVTIMKYLFWLGLPLIAWTIAFFKLKEKEA